MQAGSAKLKVFSSRAAAELLVEGPTPHWSVGRVTSGNVSAAFRHPERLLISEAPGKMLEWVDFANALYHSSTTKKMSSKRFAVDLLPFAVSAERSAVNGLQVRITATNASFEPPAHVIANAHLSSLTTKIRIPRRCFVEEFCQVECKGNVVFLESGSGRRLSEDAPVILEEQQDLLPLGIRDGFERWASRAKVAERTTWKGLATQKLPSDLFLYQEIIIRKSSFPFALLWCLR